MTVSAKVRKSLPPSRLGKPKTGGYPMKDKKHAGIAKGFAAMHHDPDKASIDAKANRILAKKHGGQIHISGKGKQAHLGRPGRQAGGSAPVSGYVPPGAPLPPASMTPPPGTPAVPKDAAVQGYEDASGRPTAALNALRGNFSQAQGQAAGGGSPMGVGGGFSPVGGGAPMGVGGGGAPMGGGSAPMSGLNPLQPLARGGRARRKS